MTKWLKRVMGIGLIPALLVDPTLAQLRLSGDQPFSRYQTSIFAQEAVVQCLANFASQGRGIINRAALQVWNLAAAQREPSIVLAGRMMAFTSLLSMILPVGMVLVSSDEGYDVSRALEAAETFLKKGDEELALNTLESLLAERVIEKLPTSAAKMAAYVQVERLTRRVQKITVEITLSKARVLYPLAVALSKLRQEESALEQAENLMKQTFDLLAWVGNKDSKNYWKTSGSAYIAQAQIGLNKWEFWGGSSKDLIDAVRSLTTALACLEKDENPHPEFHERQIAYAYGLLAWSFFHALWLENVERGDFRQQAKSFVAQALEHDPQQPQALMLQGIFQNEEGKYREAISALEPLRKLGASPLPWFELILAQISLADNDKSTSVFIQSLPFNPFKFYAEGLILVHRADALWANQKEAAIPLYEQARIIWTQAFDNGLVSLIGVRDVSTHALCEMIRIEIRSTQISEAIHTITHVATFDEMEFSGFAGLLANELPATAYPELAARLQALRGDHPRSVARLAHFIDEELALQGQPSDSSSRLAMRPLENAEHLENLGLKDALFAALQPMEVIIPVADSTETDTNKILELSARATKLEDYMKLAKALYKVKRFEEAVVAYKAALKAVLVLAALPSTLEECLNLSEDAKEAFYQIQSYRDRYNRIQQRSESMWSHFIFLIYVLQLLGQSYLQAAERNFDFYAQARNYLTVAVWLIGDLISVGPSTKLEAWLELSRVQLILTDYSSALQNAERACEFSLALLQLLRGEKLKEPIMTKSEWQLLQNDIEGSRQWITSKQATARYLSGLILAQLGEYQAAIDQLNIAMHLGLNPDQEAGARDGIKRAEELIRNPQERDISDADKALDDVTEMTRGSSPPASEVCQRLNAMYDLLQPLHRYDEMLSVFDLVLNWLNRQETTMGSNGIRAVTRYLQAMVFNELGRYDAALQAVEAGYSTLNQSKETFEKNHKKEDWWAIRNGLQISHARALFLRWKKEKIEADLRNALNLLTATIAALPKTSSEVYSDSTRCDLYMQLGRVQFNLSHLDKNPNKAAAFFNQAEENVAKALAFDEEDREAIELRDAIVQEREQATALKTQQVVHSTAFNQALKKGDLELAVAELTALEKAQWPALRIAYYRGLISYTAGQKATLPTEARTSYQQAARLWFALPLNDLVNAWPEEARRLDIFYQLIDVRLRLGEIQKAIALMRPMLEEKEQNSLLAALVVDTLPGVESYTSMVHELVLQPLVPSVEAFAQNVVSCLARKQPAPLWREDAIALVQELTSSDSALQLQAEQMWGKMNRKDSAWLQGFFAKNPWKPLSVQRKAKLLRVWSEEILGVRKDSRKFKERAPAVTLFIHEVRKAVEFATKIRGEQTVRVLLAESLLVRLRDDFSVTGLETTLKGVFGVQLATYPEVSAAATGLAKKLQLAIAWTNSQRIEQDVMGMERDITGLSELNDMDLIASADDIRTKVKIFGKDLIHLRNRIQQDTAGEKRQAFLDRYLAMIDLLDQLDRRLVLVPLRARWQTLHERLNAAIGMHLEKARLRVSATENALTAASQRMAVATATAEVSTPARIGPGIRGLVEALQRFFKEGLLIADAKQWILQANTIVQGISDPAVAENLPQVKNSLNTIGEKIESGNVDDIYVALYEELAWLNHFLFYPLSRLWLWFDFDIDTQVVRDYYISEVLVMRMLTLREHGAFTFILTQDPEYHARGYWHNQRLAVLSISWLLEVLEKEIPSEDSPTLRRPQFSPEHIVELEVLDLIGQAVDSALMDTQGLYRTQDLPGVVRSDSKLADLNLPASQILEIARFFRRLIHAHGFKDQRRQLKNFDDSTAKQPGSQFVWEEFAQEFNIDRNQSQNSEALRLQFVNDGRTFTSVRESLMVLMTHYLSLPITGDLLPNLQKGRSILDESVADVVHAIVAAIASHDLLSSRQARIAA